MQQRLSLQAARLAQVAALQDSDIDRLVQRIRSARSIPKLEYHLARHGPDFVAASEDDYLRALRTHLARSDLRIFTYLRPRDHKPFWELIAPVDGASALYHEERGSLWSFFRPIDPDARMAIVETWWIEAVRSSTGWRFEEQWQWKQ